jgi:multicomponent Na+:H+ antiporter subunit D
LTPSTEHLIALFIPALPLLLTFFILVAGRLNRKLCYFVSVTAILLQLVFALYILNHVLTKGTIHYWVGGWKPPWGIEYVVDAFDAYVLVIFLLLSVIFVLYSKKSLEQETPQKIGALYAIYQLLVTGLWGVAVAGDLLYLYWFIELISLSAYALIALRGWMALKASCAYFLAWLIGSLILLTGMRFLYAITGTYNMHDLSVILPLYYGNNAIQMAFVFFIVGLTLKMAFFPLYTWLLDAHAFGPAKISAIMSGIIILVSTYLFLGPILSVFTLNFIRYIHLNTLISGIAAIVVILGSILAIARYIKKSVGV